MADAQIGGKSHVIGFQGVQKVQSQWLYEFWKSLFFWIRQSSFSNSIDNRLHQTLVCIFRRGTNCQILHCGEASIQNFQPKMISISSGCTLLKNDRFMFTVSFRRLTNGNPPINISAKRAEGSVNFFRSFLLIPY